MTPPKCAIKGCEKRAFVMLGNKWICGECLIKIQKRQNELSDKFIEGLELE